MRLQLLRPRFGHAVLGVFVAGVLIFLYAPIIYVCANALNRDPTLFHWRGLTWLWFRKVLNDADVRDAFVSSVEIGVASAAIGVTVALTAALWLRGRGSSIRSAVEASTYARLVIPEVVLAVALFVFFRRLDLQLGKYTVIIGHSVFCSAVAAIILDARVISLDTALEDAARDLGASPRRVFMRATLPQLWPAILGSALLCFTFSFDNLVTSFFLAGSGVQTLPMLIFGLVRIQITPFANAIGAGVMLITVLGLSLAALVTRLGSARTLLK
jgi:ABC-type spermidine/putrescine transport system permease subunit II